jgi:DNA-binding transcriptional regulator YdaS (Cro superfamily)
MTVSSRPLSEVTHDAIRLLARELGVVDTARFLNQFGAGRGNYTAERGALFEGATLEQLIEEAQRLRSERDPTPRQ